MEVEYRPSIPTAIGRIDAITDAIRAEDWGLVETLTDAEFERQKDLACKINDEWAARLDKMLQVKSFRYSLMNHDKPESWRARVLEEANR